MYTPGTPYVHPVHPGMPPFSLPDTPVCLSFSLPDTYKQSRTPATSLEEVLVLCRGIAGAIGPGSRIPSRRTRAGRPSVLRKEAAPESSPRVGRPLRGLLIAVILSVLRVSRFFTFCHFCEKTAGLPEDSTEGGVDSARSVARSSCPGLLLSVPFLLV